MTRGGPPDDRLAALIGEHPSKLRDYHLGGEAVDPASLAGPIHPGEMFAFEVMKHGYGVARPLFRGISKVFFRGWNGMTFDESGDHGTNVFFKRDFLAFACRLGEGFFDGKPSLLIMYDEVPNRWPTDGVHDEIRRVSDNLLLGCTIRGGGPTIWFGIQAPRC
ncbi:MAG: hypothetical protein KC731_24885 [Myxococcales bacterium]|nr:hypothetical protein [Myxococcales bacterium]